MSWYHRPETWGTAVCPTCGVTFQRRGGHHVYCCDYHTPHKQKLRQRTHRKPNASDPVRFDTAKLRREIHAAGYTFAGLSLDLGYDGSYVSILLRRGVCNFYTLDDIAGKLCIHVDSLISEEVPA
jgi:hypothetical protein